MEKSFNPEEYLNSLIDNTPSDFNPQQYLNDKINEDVVNTAITNKVSTMSEPDESYIQKVGTFLRDMSYYSNDLKTGVYKGVPKAITSTAKFFADIADKPDAKEWLDDADGYINKYIQTTSKAGEVGETIGRVGAGIYATGGMGVATIPARMTQGFLIDLLAFEGKSGNIADVFDSYDINLGGLTDLLKTDMEDTEFVSRMKNALGGALVGGALETTVAGLKFGKDLIRSNNIELKGTDAEIMSTVMDTLKKETDETNKLKVDIQDKNVEYTKAQINEGTDLFNRATEMIKDAPDNFDELVKNGEQVVKQSDNVSSFDSLISSNNLSKVVEDKSTLDAIKYSDGITILLKDINGRDAGAIESLKLTNKELVAEGLSTDSKALQIFNTAIDDNLKGKGIGTGLYESLIAEAKNKGYTYLLSDSSVSESASKVWDKLGAVKNTDFYKTAKGIDGKGQNITNDNKALYMLDLSAYSPKSNNVDATLNMKQPLNAEKITPTNAETLAKATQNIEADASFESHKDLLKRADKDLEEKLGKEGYEVVKDLTDTAESVENLSLKVTQARVVVGNLTDKYQQALNVAKKEGGAESMMRAMLALDNLMMVSRTLKNTTSSVAKAMSAMRINTESSNLFNSLKIMDSIDSDYSMSLLRDAFSKNNAEEVFKIMENFSDATKKMKDHIDNYQDSMYKKIGNVLSEGVVASMLSAPSTLAVNVIGNSFVNHQRFLQDTLQFLSGQVLRGSDRMKGREYRYLLHSNFLSNANDLKIVGKNIKEWANSGFKDEKFDEAVLARYVQDQEHQHKYISSQYIRGIEIGNQNSLMNTVINTYGKLARSPYKVIGAIDDYYKRNAFRSELVRVGSRLADARGISDDMYNEFLDKFIKVNTELHILRNNGHKPTTRWIKENKNYIGAGEGLFKYADEARDHANYMTFQTELKGAVGSVVDALNSDGFLRILVPFKTSPINMLKMSASTALQPLNRELYKDIFVTGGAKRDIAIAKLAYSSSVLTGLGYLISSGNVTGSFKDTEREAMASAGIPEYSYRVGNTWYEYKQLEPIATILGVMTDIFRLQQDAMVRKDDLINDPTFDNFAEEIGTVMGDLGMSIVNNVVNKTYAKSLSDTMALMNGDGNLVNYSGNLISSAVPFSSLANFVGRNFGDGYKKEASKFSEKLLSKYRVFLDRDALDAYGRPIKEIDYTPLLTKKSVMDAPENIGALEVARLGINVHKMSKIVNYKGIPVKLKAEEYHAMRRALDTHFQLADRLTDIVSSESYKSQSDYAKKEILTNVINKIKEGATVSVLSNPRVQSELNKGISKVITSVSETENKDTFNNMIMKGIQQ